MHFITLPDRCVELIIFFTFFQDGEIDLKLLTKVLSPETEVFEVGLPVSCEQPLFRGGGGGESLILSFSASPAPLPHP